MNIEQAIYFAISHILMGWIAWTSCCSFQKYSERIGELQKEVGRLKLLCKLRGTWEESDGD